MVKKIHSYNMKPNMATEGDLIEYEGHSIIDISDNAVSAVAPPTIKKKKSKKKI